MSDDWAKRKLEELNSRETEQSERQKLEFQRRHWLITEAPNVWKSVKEALSKNIATFNASRPSAFNYQEPSGEVDTQNIYIGGPKGYLRAVFYIHAPRVVVSFYASRATSIEDLLQEERKYIFEIIQEEVWLVEADQNKRYTVGQIAGQWLDKLV